MIGGPPRNWKRPVGRPRQTWLRVLTSDLLPMDLGPNAAWRIAQNRDRWQQDAEMATLRRGARLWWWWAAIVYLRKWKKWQKRWQKQQPKSTTRPMCLYVLKNDVTFPLAAPGIKILSHVEVDGLTIDLFYLHTIQRYDGLQVQNTPGQPEL